MQDDSLLSKYYESLWQQNFEARVLDVSLSYGKKFLAHSHQIGNAEYVARALSHISTTFSFMGQNDSSYHYLQQTLPLLDSIGRTDRAYILANLGIESDKQDDKERAEEYLRESLALEIADPHIRINTLSCLVEMLLEENAYQDAYELRTEMYALNDSINDATKTQEVTAIQLRYDKMLVEKKLAERTIRFLAAIILIIVAVAALACYHFYRERVFRNRIAENVTRIYEKETEIAQLKEEQQSTKESMEKLEVLQQEVNDMRQSIGDRIRKGLDIYDLLLKNGKLPPYPEAEESLIEFYSLLRFDVYQQWMSNYRKLTKRLLTYLILQDMGKDDHEIARTLSVEESSIRSIKSRIRAQLRH